MKKMIVAVLLCMLIGTAFTQEVPESKGDSEYIGEIILFAGTFAPSNFMDCDGRLLSIQVYTTLFSVIGTQFGGDGINTFALPDLRGRAPIGYGDGPSTSANYMGQQGGYETVALNSTQIPSHSHSGTVNSTGTIMVDSGTANDDSPSGNSFSRAEIDVYSTNPGTAQMLNGVVETNGSFTTDASGSGASHMNMQPYLTIRYCICVNGLYPPRSKEEKK
ncbi:MAG: tail fiber protein [Candidatus Delongbacteria bacterium]|jgi:microcystin-dependent protein|nr:tail fiber protein [Candidatus Delongbacteria bacterium]